MKYKYHRLSGPFEHKARYNVFGVVSEIYQHTHRDDKGKLKAIVAIQDESVGKPFKLSIFCRKPDETIPPIQTECIVRLHRMQVENYNGGFDGRVFCAETDIVVFPKDYPSEDFIALRETSVTDEDKKRVAELQVLRETLSVIENVNFDDDFDGDGKPTKRACTSSEEPSCVVRGKDLRNLVNPAFVPKNGDALLPAKTAVTTAASIAVSTAVSTAASSAASTAASVDATHQDDSSPVHPFLDTEPSISELREDPNSKGLVQWECICKKRLKSSEVIWLSSPQERTLGSTKCPHCGAEGMALPFYNFSTIVKVGTNKKKRSCITNTTAPQLLTMTVLEYVFTEGKSIEAHEQLSRLKQP